MLEKSKLYQRFEQYSLAIATLERIQSTEIDQTNQCEFFYEKTLNLFLNKSFTQALSTFRSLEYLCAEETEKIKLLHMAVLLENELWDEFQQEYLKIIQNGSSVDSVAFRNVFTSPIWLNPQVYKRMSSFLPGLGLMKSGEPMKGATNLFLNIASLGFAAFNIYNGFYATGFFSGILPAKRFYNGGKILTGSSIEKLNESKIADMKHIGYLYLKKFDNIK
ncbi:MAG: hypothetical protein M3512_15685 [Bacteroidota bacterium]|nr:hypothetical protein [Bacteroidota bacterium]